MQVGGSLGTAVLGAVMASKVDGDLPGNWTRRGPAAADARAAGPGVRRPSRSACAPVAEGHPAGDRARRSPPSRTTRSCPAWAWPSRSPAVVAVVAGAASHCFTKRGENAEAGARRRRTSDRASRGRRRSQRPVLERPRRSSIRRRPCAARHGRPGIAGVQAPSTHGSHGDDPDMRREPSLARTAPGRRRPGPGGPRPVAAAPRPAAAAPPPGGLRDSARRRASCACGSGTASRGARPRPNWPAPTPTTACRCRRRPRTCPWRTAAPAGDGLPVAECAETGEFAHVSGTGTWAPDAPYRVGLQGLGALTRAAAEAGHASAKSRTDHQFLEE